jgi:hypothetical protein
MIGAIKVVGVVPQDPVAMKLKVRVRVGTVNGGLKT